MASCGRMASGLALDQGNASNVVTRPAFTEFLSTYLTIPSELGIITDCPVIALILPKG